MKILIGILLVIGGVLGSAASVSADYTGLNVTQEDKDCKDFGWCQVAASAAGGAIALGGIAFLFISKKPEDAPERTEFVENETEDREPASTKDVSPPLKGAEQKTQDEALQTDTQAASQPQSVARDAAQTHNEAQALEDRDGLDALATDLGLDASTQFECPDCGGALPEDAKSCPTCGADFEEKDINLEDTAK